jgi:hypothetical protein|tara:strand:+ start:1874 stop:3445 length:1572 start_codon:yes stop_codon:yes gene_type:complete
MDILDNTLEEFVELFQGSTTYFGVSKPTGKKNSKGKSEFKHWLEPHPMTKDHWKQHLKGEAYYGSVPIRDNNTCNWGVIDVDRYNIRHQEIIKVIRQRRYPLVPYRSKSNGLHLILHIDGVIPASTMRRKLIEIASDLGINDTTTDIFPAQDEVDLSPEKWDDKRKGNFVNLPYQKANMTTRVAMDDEGNSIKLENLFKFVKQFRLTPAEFKKLKIFQDDETKDYPPCVINFMKNKVQKGEGRNDAMFNVAVLAKKINPDPVMYEDWTRKMMPKVCSDNLHPKELQNIFKGVENKDYAYKCKTSIARVHCVSNECVKRKLGIGCNEAMPEVGKLIKVNSYPEPYWILPIQGKSIRLSTKQLYQQQLLGEQVLNFDIVWRTLKPSKRDPDPYRDWLEELITNKQDMEGFDALEEKLDVFNSRMTRFLEDVEDTTEFDQIDNGNIWKDDKEMRFKLETFRQFIKKMGYNWSEKDCTKFLESGGAVPKKKFQGIDSRHWLVNVPKQTEHRNKDVKFIKTKPSWEDN